MQRFWSKQHLHSSAVSFPSLPSLLERSDLEHDLEDEDLGLVEEVEAEELAVVEDIEAEGLAEIYWTRQVCRIWGCLFPSGPSHDYVPNNMCQ